MAKTLLVDENGKRWVPPSFTLSVDDGRAWLIDGTKRPPEVESNGQRRKLSISDLLALARCMVDRRAWAAGDLFPKAASARRRFESARKKVDDGGRAFLFAGDKANPAFRFSPGAGLKFALLLAEEEACQLGVVPPERSDPGASASDRDERAGVAVDVHGGKAVCMRDTPVIVVRLALRTRSPQVIEHFSIQAGSDVFRAVAEPTERIRGRLPLRGWMLDVVPPVVTGTVAFLGQLWGNPNWQGRRAILVTKVADGCVLESPLTITW